MTRVPGPRMRSLALIGLAALLMLAIGAVLGTRPGRPAAGTTDRVAPAEQPTPGNLLAAAIARAQQRLRVLPGDYVTWAGLGSAYLEQARVGADPGFYPKAEGALRRSLALRPSDNAMAMAGLGALANARHDFAGARGWALRALRVDGYDADAYGVLTDAETQLGHAAAATDAVQHMLDLRPGLAAYARGSYDLEQHGRLTEAEALMRRALDAAIDPTDIAFCRYQLGELAWQGGRLADAEREYASGLAAAPAYLPLREGRAKAAAAGGQLDAALTGYADLTARYPTPGYLLEYAELLRAAGRGTQAGDQLSLAAAGLALFTANGGADDLSAANLALARGKPAEAVRLARREWQRRQFADVADVLGWALHQIGQDAAALGYARRAGALGAHPARYSYHLGLIELALGQRAAARQDLRQALSTNPYFSPLDAPVAARTLSTLES